MEINEFKLRLIYNDMAFFYKDDAVLQKNISIDAQTKSLLDLLENVGNDYHEINKRLFLADSNHPYFIFHLKNNRIFNSTFWSFTFAEILNNREANYFINALEVTESKGFLYETGRFNCSVEEFFAIATELEIEITLSFPDFDSFLSIFFVQKSKK